MSTREAELRRVLARVLITDRLRVPVLPAAPLSGLDQDPSDSPRVFQRLAEHWALSAQGQGASAILLREKDLPTPALRKLACELARHWPGPLMIAADLAAAAEAPVHGLHLPGGGGAPRAARRALAPGAWVSAAVHSPADAHRALAQGADWLLFGPVCDTVKGGERVPGQGFEGLRDIVRSVPLPVVGVGGLSHRTEAAVRATGAAGWAAIRSFEKAPAPARGEGSAGR